MGLVKVRKARLAMERAIADPWAGSRALQARQAQNSRDFIAAVRSVQDYAIALVKGDDQRVRAEDLLAVLAAATGEATLVDSGSIDIEGTDLIPGQGIFGPAINRVLSGDGTTPAEPELLTVVGIMHSQLVPALVPEAAFPSVERLYRHVAEHVGASPWGTVAVTVPEAHRPHIIPIKCAFEMRPVVDDEAERLRFRVGPADDGRPTGWSRHGLGAMALASAISQTAATLDPRIATTLALEVSFGMAKMVPMSRRALDRARPQTS